MNFSSCVHAILKQMLGRCEKDIKTIFSTRPFLAYGHHIYVIKNIYFYLFVDFWKYFSMP